MTIRILSATDGFRRAGMVHAATPTDYADKHFTLAQLALLMAEVELLVWQVDDKGVAKLLSTHPQAAAMERRALRAPSDQPDANAAADLAALTVERDALLAERDALAAERDGLVAERDALAAACDALEQGAAATDVSAAKENATQPPAKQGKK